MLSEIAAEALHFLSRRDLDKASAVSKWFDALIAHSCNVYPLRAVREVALYPNKNDFKPFVRIDYGSTTHRSFDSMDEAAHFTGAILRLSYVKELKLGHYSGSMSLSSGQWASLNDEICKGAVRSLQFACVDCSALDKNMLLVAAGCRGLKKLVIQQCVLPSGFVLDDLLRSSVANGVLHLRTFKNSPESARRLSDDAVLF